MMTSSKSTAAVSVSKRPRGGDDDQAVARTSAKRSRTSGPDHAEATTTTEAKVPEVNRNWDRIADTLVCDGVAVFPLYTKHVAEALAKLLAHEVTHAPEWLPDKKPVVMRTQRKRRVAPAERHSLGGFGGVRANSVNHGTTAIFVRDEYDTVMRKHLMPRVAQRLARGVKRAEWSSGEKDGAIVEIRGFQVLDRALVRDADSNVTRESKHRDLGTVDDPSTVMCGGWMALGTANGAPQTFRCARGTSLWARTKGGFNKAAAKTIPADVHMETISIPLGWGIVFDESIVHSVERSPKPRGLPQPHAPMTRVFTAYCLTTTPPSDECKAHVTSILEDGADFLLKSGQPMPAYPAMYWGLQFDTLDAATRRLCPMLRETRTVSSPTSKHYGRVVHTPLRTKPWPSVVELGLPQPLYPPELVRSFVDGYVLLPTTV